MEGVEWGRSYGLPDRWSFMAEFGLSFARGRRSAPRWQRHERASERQVLAHRPLLAAREAFLAEWHRAIGTVDVWSDPRQFAVITGLTA